ncbi:hypothetical protein PILCRDRAFT_15630 [Piloderma croceum F 1598]|uniref:Uncharacterized protein n=1 Tax=Piloderma croceum (strain F 1598) TaxID=765440 RepID=A0A0C3EYC2_PILCF|nr:hypothetical protein PILCRDRAFT_15630 [Piloderma croceum F 1598]
MQDPMSEAILQRDHFNRNLIDSDEEEQDETDEEDSQDEANSSDEDSDAEIKHLKHKTKCLKEIFAMCKVKKKSLTKKYIDSNNEKEPRQKKTTATQASKSINHKSTLEELAQSEGYRTSA